MKTLVFRNFLASLFPNDLIINGATTVSPSISVFPGPEGRSSKTPFVGGAECDDFKKLPINILVRWSTDTDLAYEKALAIYNELKGRNNFTFESAEIATIMLLDDQPVWLGRAEGNIVEYTIRADIYYFMEVSNEAH